MAGDLLLREQGRRAEVRESLFFFSSHANFDLNLGEAYFLW